MIVTPPQVAAGVLVAICGFLIVPLPQSEPIAAFAAGAQVTGALSTIAFLAGIGAGFIWWRTGHDAWEAVAIGLIVGGSGTFTAFSLLGLAFIVGRWSGLGPVKGVVPLISGAVLGFAISVGVLGFQPVESLANAGWAIAIATAVSAWFLASERAPGRWRGWAPWAAAASGAGVVAVIGGGIGLLISSPAGGAVVRVVNFGPGPVSVSTSPTEALHFSHPSTGVALACGQTMLVHAPKGSNGPWRLYAGFAQSQINGANNVPFDIYEPSTEPAVLLAPVRRAWVERWLPPAKCG